MKFSLLTLTNVGEDPGTLSVFAYNDWGLGPPRDGQQFHVVTDYASDLGAMFARNPYAIEFASRVAFLAASETPGRGHGRSRAFIGRNGSIASPAALADPLLAGRFGAGLDPCAALQVHVALEPGTTHDARLPAGQGRDMAHARDLIARHARPDAAAAARAAVAEFWDRTLDTVQVQTPDDSFDVLINRWLLYQDISCRLWTRDRATTSRAARSAFAISCRT